MLVSDPVSCPSLLVSRAWSCATLSAWLLLLYYHDLSNGDLNYIQWESSMIKIHINKSHLIGTDGDDSFDVDYYNNHNFFDLDLITHFLAGDGDDIMGGSESD
jgi:hypothetical protein